MADGKSTPHSNKLVHAVLQAIPGPVAHAHARGSVPGTVSHSVESITVDGFVYETLPQTELDELRRAKRLRDEAIAALRGDANSFEELRRRAESRGDKSDAQEVFDAKAEQSRAALRYLGADDE